MKKEELSMPEKIKFIQDTLYTVSGKWKLPILMAMFGGADRFKDLQRSVTNITTRVLSKELKELELNKLIVRNIHDTYPVSITYTLTEYAFTLTPLVNEMIDWGRAHRSKVSEK